MTNDLLFVKREAVFSPDHRHRYLFSRTWAEGNPLYFVMLNPSTADENGDDPTILSCTRLAVRSGYAGIKVLNLFAIVSTDPHKLTTEPDAVGADNDRYLREAAGKAEHIVVAWGNFIIPYHLTDRVTAVLEIFKNRNLYCFGKTESGQPRHPLYIPRVQPLELWKEKEI